MHRTLVVFFLASSLAADNQVNGKLFRAVLDSQIDVVKGLLAAGADINARDARQATPLMYAAGVGSREMVATLLDAGADVNLMNINNSTALLWGIRDVVKVRMLVENGADVNIANKLEITPLVAALTAPGNLDVVEFLLSKGAIAKVGDRPATNPLVLAYRSGDVRVIKALAARGLKLSKKDDLGDKPFAALGPSAPMEHIRTLLDMGASPDELGRTLTLTLPALAMFANSGRSDAVGLLLARGANPNLQGNKGHTALMLAAGAVRPVPGILRSLLDAGAKVNITDENGQTALDWALKQGETEITALLREAGGKALSKPVFPAPIEKVRSIPEAISKVTPLLDQAGQTSARKVTCLNCHNNSLTALALNTVQQRGFPVTEEMAAHYPQAFAKPETSRPWDAAFWNQINSSYMEWALAESGYPRGIDTEVVVLRSLRTQREDGRWGSDGDTTRPPLSSFAIKTTAFNVRILNAWASTATLERTQEAIRKARGYLKTATPGDTQEVVFQLLGLRWSGASASEIQPVMTRLLALQRGDGGWGQKPTMPTDAYATGQALYALHIGAQVAGTDARYQQGVKFLLRNQMEDGSWFVPTRAFGFQPYYESGFPHGVHQYISASASSWAAMALSFASPDI